MIYSKTCLKQPLKTEVLKTKGSLMKVESIAECSLGDKTKVLKTNGSLMNVESIAECSLGAFCNTFDLH